LLERLDESVDQDPIEAPISETLERPVMPNLRGLSLGDPTADANTLFGKGCFVETDLYQECLALNRTAFIVGRRGAGKTIDRKWPTHPIAIRLAALQKLGSCGFPADGLCVQAQPNPEIRILVPVNLLFFTNCRLW
jgi:hypothetical protein